MKIAIIGGGLSGLVAGYALSDEHNITLYEREEGLGGLLSSYHTDTYSIERYYHHFFTGDTEFQKLIGELNLSGSIVWLSGSTGSYVNGEIYPLTTPLEILRYPFLSIRNKIRLGLFTKKATKLEVSDLDRVTAREYIIDELGEEIYHSFFEPLLISKFGENRDKISAAWLISRVAIRSDRGITGERLGYIKGGFSVFVDKLVDSASARGCHFLCNTPVTSVKKDNEGWIVDGESYDLVISTVAPHILRDLGIDLPDVAYQGSACLTLALAREVTNGIYWINMTDPAPYGAVISHTSFTPYAWYDEHLIYLASYFTGSSPSDLKERMISDFMEKFSVRKDEIHWSRLAVDPYAGPLYLTGYQANMIHSSLPGLYLAGMFSPENYPERSIEGSIRVALSVVRQIKNME